MSQQLGNRLFRGLAAQGFSQASGLVIQFATVPLFLHFWGKALFGVWLLLSTIPSYFALSDLGFASAAGNEMTMLVAREDRRSALEVFQSAWVFVTALSLTVLLGAVTFVWLAPLERLLHLAPLSHRETASLSSVLALQVLVSLQMGLVSAGYRCDGHFATGILASNLQRIGEFLVGAAVIVTGGGLWRFVLATLAARVVSMVLMWLDLRRRCPWLSIGVRHARRAVIRRISSPALAFMGFPVGFAISLQGVVTVIGLVLGPTAVVQFSTLRTLTRFVRQVQESLAQTVGVEISAAFGIGDLPLARRLHRRVVQLSLWFALAVLAGMSLAGPAIYHVWTGGRIPFSRPLFELLLVGIVFSSLWSASNVVLMATNRHQAFSVIFLVSNIVSLGGVWLFVRQWGLIGVAVALLITELSFIGYVLRRSLALLEDTPGGLRIVLTPPVAWLRAKLGGGALVSAAAGKG